jgi:hypothetical protein
MPSASVTAASAAPERAWSRIEVAERQPGRNRQPTGQPREEADRQRAEEQGAENRRHDSTDDEESAVPVGDGKEGDADRDQRCARGGGMASRPRLGRPSRQREHDRQPSDDAAGPPRGGRRGQRREEHGQRDQVPRNGEPVDAVVGRGLDQRGEDDPECDTEGRPDDGGDRAGECAVRHEHQAEVFLRRADRSEHPELPQPPLRGHREARGGDERGEQEEDGRDREHRQRVRALFIRPHLGTGDRQPAALRANEGLDGRAVRDD